jgi:tRNA(adenine34) deaminase
MILFRFARKIRASRFSFLMHAGNVKQSTAALPTPRHTADGPWCYSSNAADAAMDDTDYMKLAVEEAHAAANADEVPIGAVLVSGGEVLGRGANRTIRDCDPTAHAEIVALREAAKRAGNYRLSGTTLYVTLEPCAMCAGAIIQARVARVVYGADDPKGGAVRTCFEVLTHPKLNHQVDITSGILVQECATLLQKFFTARR